MIAEVVLHAEVVVEGSAVGGVVHNLLEENQIPRACHDEMVVPP